MDRRPVGQGLGKSPLKHFLDQQHENTNIRKLPQELPGEAGKVSP